MREARTLTDEQWRASYQPTPESENVRWDYAQQTSKQEIWKIVVISERTKALGLQPLAMTL
jgi:hypothetical protein